MYLCMTAAHHQGASRCYGFTFGQLSCCSYLYAVDWPGCQTDLKFPESFCSVSFFRDDTPPPPLLQPGQPWEFRCSSTFCHSQRAFLFPGEAPRLICRVLLYSTVCGRAACPLVWPLRHKDRRAWLVISLVHWRGLSLALQAHMLGHVKHDSASLLFVTNEISYLHTAICSAVDLITWTRLIIAFSIFFLFILTST